MDIDRRRWVFPPGQRRFQGIDLESLDPGDEDDRRLLVAAEHPDLVAAVEAGADEVDIHGERVNPRLHLLMHELVAAQVWEGNPPEVLATAERLADSGYERHEVLHLIGSVLAREMWHLVRQREPFDEARYLAALEALPEPAYDEDDDDDFAEPSLPDGTTVTHRLSEAEVAGGFVLWSDDLLPLAPILDDRRCLPLTGGGVARPEVGDDGERSLRGPTGWLHGAGAGDTLGFRVTGTEVEVVPVGAVGPVEGFGPALISAFERLNEGDRMPVTAHELIGAALEELGDGDQTQVLPPVGELLLAHGFEIRDGFTGPAGTDWESFELVRHAASVALLRGLDPVDAHPLVMLVQTYRLFADGRLAIDDGDADLTGELADLVGDADIGPAFVDVLTSRGDAGAIGDFAEVLRAASGRARPGPIWLAAVARRHQGDHAGAENLLAEALRAAPDHAPSLEDAARYASDRGDARRAVDLLGRLAEQGDGVAAGRAEFLGPFTRTPRALARRNDPCPCGSGAKYKHCCLNSGTSLPLPERVGWVWDKLVWFLSGDGFLVDVEDVVDELELFEDDGHLLAQSLVLFQDGAVDDFLAGRGSLLPDDERNLVGQWALTNRSVHEVVSVARGAGLTLRDIRTGDLVDVRERLGSMQASAGDLLFAHVVPDGVGHQLIGGVVPVPLRLRDSLMVALDQEATSVEVAHLIARAFAPPEMFTMEGEPVVLCEARYRLDDPTAAGGLDAVLDRDADDRWSESVEVDGRAWVRGTVALTGGELVVSANSEERFRRLRQAVEGAVPELVVLGETMTPATEALAARGTRLPGIDRSPPPEIADALAEFVRQQEQRWLDEEVPALGGLTPRQAAADPVAREQLIALLHDFDRLDPPAGGATFDTARLRAALGLGP